MAHGLLNASGGTTNRGSDGTANRKGRTVQRIERSDSTANTEGRTVQIIERVGRYSE